VHTVQVDVLRTVDIVFVSTDEQQKIDPRSDSALRNTDREDPDCPIAEDTALFRTLLSHGSAQPDLNR